MAISVGEPRERVTESRYCFCVFLHHGYVTQLFQGGLYLSWKAAFIEGVLVPLSVHSKDLQFREATLDE